MSGYTSICKIRTCPPAKSFLDKWVKLFILSTPLNRIPTIFVWCCSTALLVAEGLVSFPIWGEFQRIL
jgi:hypothetical protein